MELGVIEAGIFAWRFHTQRKMHKNSGLLYVKTSDKSLVVQKRGQG
jgi:hypothetical protein